MFFYQTFQKKSLKDVLIISWVIKNHEKLHECTYLGGLSVWGLLDLVGPLVGVSNTEDAELVAVGGGDVDVAVDHGLPLLHHGAKLVTVW